MHHHHHHKRRALERRVRAFWRWLREEVREELEQAEKCGNERPGATRLRVVAVCGTQPIGEIIMFSNVKVGEKRFFIVEALDDDGNVVALPGPVGVTPKDPAIASASVNQDGTGGILTAVGVPSGLSSVVGEIVVSSMNLAATIDFNVVAPVVIGPPPPPPPKPATGLRVTEVDADGVPVSDTDKTLASSFPNATAFNLAVAVYDGGSEVDLDDAIYRPGGTAPALGYFTQADGSISQTRPTPAQPPVDTPPVETPPADTPPADTPPADGSTPPTT